MPQRYYYYYYLPHCIVWNCQIHKSQRPPPRNDNDTSNFTLRTSTVSKSTIHHVQFTIFTSFTSLILRVNNARVSSFVEFHIVESFIHFVQWDIPILDDWQLLFIRISWLGFVRSNLTSWPTGEVEIPHWSLQPPYARWQHMTKLHWILCKEAAPRRKYAELEKSRSTVV